MIFRAVPRRKPCIPPEGVHVSVEGVNGAVFLGMPVTDPAGNYVLTGFLEIPRSQVDYLLQRLEEEAYRSDCWAATCPEKDVKRPRMHPLLMPPTASAPE